MQVKYSYCLIDDGYNWFTNSDTAYSELSRGWYCTFWSYRQQRGGLCSSRGLSWAKLRWRWSWPEALLVVKRIGEKHGEVVQDTKPKLLSVKVNDKRQCSVWRNVNSSRVGLFILAKIMNMPQTALQSVQHTTPTIIRPSVLFLWQTLPSVCSPARFLTC